jgi:hypothetical protein
MTTFAEIVAIERALEKLEDAQRIVGQYDITEPSMEIQRLAIAVRDDAHMKLVDLIIKVAQND